MSQLLLLLLTTLAGFSIAQLELNEPQDVCALCSCANGTVDCSGKRLQSAFSMNDTWPANMTTLLMDLNAIGSVLVFPPLPIKVLSFRYNEIVNIEKRAFYNLSKLEDLDLSHNQLITADLTPEVFEGPFSASAYEPLTLLSLNLSYNELTSLHQDLLEHFPRLQRLFLAHNPLADSRGMLDRFTTVAICSVEKLQVLDLTATGLNHLPDTFLSNLPDLEELFLGENTFLRIPVESLSYSRNLKVLNLNNNPMKLIKTEDKLRNLDKLVQLHISSMPELTRIEEHSLSELTSLNFLDCKLNPKLEHISVDALNAANLTRIDLNDNNLRYIPEGLVSNWTTLKHIDIRGNPLTCECKNQWIIVKLMGLQSMRKDGLLCSAPDEMLGRNLQELYEKHYDMRCLDYYGNRPERDSTFLVITFIIVVVVLLTIGIVWKLKGGRCRQGRDIDYTAIYQQAVRDDDKF